MLGALVDTWKHDLAQGLTAYAVVTSLIYAAAGAGAYAWRNDTAGYVCATLAGIGGGAAAAGTLGLGLGMIAAQGHSALEGQGYAGFVGGCLGLVAGALAGGITAGMLSRQPGERRAITGAVFAGIGVLCAAVSALLLYRYD